MSLRDDALSLKDMLDHSREAVQLLGGFSRETFRNERVLQLALTRLVEIVSEAASRVSPAKQVSCPDIPWQRIIGMRNRLAHGYDVIDYDLLWDTIASDLPPLIVSLETALAA